MLDSWLPWLIGAFVVVHLLWFAYLIGRWGSDARTEESIPWAEPGGDADPEVTAHSQDVVVCEHCETENEVGYRFCAGCVEELPGGITMRRSGGPASGRGLF